MLKHLLIFCHVCLFRFATVLAFFVSRVVIVVLGFPHRYNVRGRARDSAVASVLFVCILPFVFCYVPDQLFICSVIVMLADHDFSLFWALLVGLLIFIMYGALSYALYSQRCQLMRSRAFLQGLRSTCTRVYVMRFAINVATPKHVSNTVPSNAQHSR